jgi:hypothetical protein
VALDLSRSSVAIDRLSTVTLKRVLDVPVYVLLDSAGRQQTVRADTGRPFTVDPGWFERVASAFFRSPVTLSDVRYLSDYDSYYYARNNRNPVLPVYRATVNDEDRTLVYVSADTGEVTGRASREFRIRRWLAIGPHAWDWPFLLRRPALWNAVSVTLIAGGLWVTLSGLYLGIQFMAASRKTVRLRTDAQRRRAS